MLALPRDAHNPNLGFICLPVRPPRPPATSHYLSFSQIPLIAIHPPNYDVGGYLCVQLTFKCQVLIEDVNADCGAPSDMLESGEHVLNCLELSLSLRHV